MPQPYNYLTTAQNPTKSLLDSLAAVQGLQKVQADQRTAELAQTTQAALQTDLAAVSKNPTAANVSTLMVKYPQLSEGFKRVYDTLDNEQQKAKINSLSNVYAALDAGNVTYAEQLIADQAEAYRNSGNMEQAKVADDLAMFIKRAPVQAQTTVGLMLSSAMGPEKFTETFTRLQSERREAARAPAELTKAQSEARKAAVDAEFAESQAVADLQKKGWDIYKIQEDVKISKENSRIAAMNADLARETNALKRQELEQKISDAKDKRDQKVRDQAAELETARAGVDNSLNTIDRLLENPELKNVVGALEGSKFYPSTLFAILNPMADADRRADATADIKTVQAQQFLDNLMAAKQRGATFGSLTEQEGAKLEGYVRSLNTKQSEGQFIDNLREIQRILLKSRAKLAEKYGVPDTIPDRPDAATQPPAQPPGDMPPVDTSGFKVLGVEGQ